jgi:hypothetical protein
MGCDIHFVIEKRSIRDANKWVGIYSTGYEPFYVPDEKNPNEWAYNRRLAKSRDYAFFAELASVRGKSSESREPKGCPGDASDLTFEELKRMDGDAHSKSWLTAREFVSAYMKAQELAIPYMEEHVAKHPKLEIFQKTLNEQRAFIARLKEKEFIPFDALLGIELEDADNVRVVFWFDN